MSQAAINGLELAGKNIVVQAVQELPPMLANIAPGLMPGVVPGLGAPSIGAGAMGSLDDNMNAERQALLERLQARDPPQEE